uniref:Uncharacterized protein n=1 Tax=Heterorhabditis bacteriophora TaxID=37862 RepID=A0A1I7WCC6_HETBA
MIPLFVIISLISLNSFEQNTKEEKEYKLQVRTLSLQRITNCTTLRTALCRLINSFVVQSTSYSQFEISLEHLEYLSNLPFNFNKPISYFPSQISRENEYSRLVLLKKNNFPLKLARFSTIYLYIFKVARLFGVMFQFLTHLSLMNFLFFNI